MTEPPTGLEDLVRRTREALAGQATVDPAELEQRVYAGSAADGLARAEVDARGRVRLLAIEPDLFRQPMADVAAAARAAINAALDSRPGRADLSPLVDALREAGEQARRELASATQAIAQITSEVRAARGTATREHDRTDQAQ
jgi:DNA-binding protein YbaB